jgi:DNA-binding LacI/PurR family transcriptional regulator
MYDICARTGLSSATVSRVVNDKGSISAKTRRIVLKAIDELDYQPNQAARALAGKKTEAIGVLLPEIDNGFYVQVLKGIAVAVKESRMHQLITFYDDPQELRKMMLSLSSGGRTDALIIMNNMLPDEEIKNLVKGRLPVILIGSDSASYDVVGMDNQNGAYAAAKHLIDQGRKNIVIITGPEQNIDSIQRMQGVKKAFEDAGRDFSKVRMLRGEFALEGGREAMEHFLSESDVPPDAVLALNDSMALGVMEVLARKDIRVPEDVVVTGFDDSEAAGHAGLSSVHVPMRDIGYEAANLAIRRIDQDNYNPTCITVNTSLHLRETA